MTIACVFHVKTPNYTVTVAVIPPQGPDPCECPALRAKNDIMSVTFKCLFEVFYTSLFLVTLLGE